MRKFAAIVLISFSLLAIALLEQRVALTQLTTSFVDHQPPQEARKNDVAITVSFRFGKDPQRSTIRGKDEFDSIKPWYNSCQSLHMTCIVLYDTSFTQDFIRNHTAVTFRQTIVTNSENGNTLIPPNQDLQGLTVNDMRFIAALDYLESRPDIDYVLLTDGSDVVFGRDPFHFMRAMDDSMKTQYVYTQEEWRPRISMSGKEGGNDTALNRLPPYYKGCFDEEMPQAWLAGRMINCGILGGHRNVVMPFLKRVRYWYTKVPAPSRFLMCDMLVFARVVFEDYHDKVVSGYPFHAKFKNAADGEVAAIYHKNDGYKYLNDTIS